jgi:acyl-coenzyme A synthetase/AMP-(fatty) acid ligase
MAPRRQQARLDRSREVEQGDGHRRLSSQRPDRNQQGAGVEPHGPSFPTSVLEVLAADPGREVLRDDLRWHTIEELVGRAGALLERLDETGTEGPVMVAPEGVVDATLALLAANARRRPILLADRRRSPEALAALAAAAGVRVLVAQGADVPGTTRIDPGTTTVAPFVPLINQPEDRFAVGSTSGSTGTPKLVTQLHAHLMVRVDQEVAPYALLPTDRVLRVFTQATAVLSNLARTLADGVPLYCPDPLRVPLSDIARTIARERITYARAVPSMLRRLARACPPDVRFEAMRLIGGGGEPMLWSDVADLRPLVPEDCLVFHGYASTETGPIARRLVPSDEPIGAGALPVGWPVADREVWIDAGDGGRAGPGVLGEIVVEGPLGTVDARIEDLGAGRQRLRTGDLGEISMDGELTHRGRADRMVKIGGVRIEPGAVEDLLRSAPGVLDACVVPVQLGEHDQRLVAHVVVDPARPPDIDALRSHAGRGLVSAAVPSRFVLREAPLPTLPSGKVDRAALSAGDSRTP